MTAEIDDLVICRACIKECTGYKSLHKQGIIMGEVTTLGHLLSFCIGVDFTAEDDGALPSNICEHCIQSLAKTYAFKKMVLESNEVLSHQQEELNDSIEATTSEPAETTLHYDAEENEDGGTILKDLNEESELQELANAAVMHKLTFMTVTVVDDEEAEEKRQREEEAEEEDELILGEEEHVEVHEIVEDRTDIYQSEQEDSQEEIIKLEADAEEYQLEYEGESYEVTLADINSMEHNDEEEELEELSQSSSISRKRSHMASAETRKGPKRKKPFKTRNKNTQPKPANPELQCSICGKQLSNLNSFKYHMQLHSDATPYLCSLCGEGFKTRNAYDGHMNIHDPNNPNTCELCGKIYRQSSSLRTHMLTHTGEKPYQCDICGKGMTQKSGYKKHMLVHTGEKPHVCDTCGREFRYSSNLISHKRCHSGEKPYECAHCSKTFPTSDQMKRHMLVHTGERPFSCEQCGKSFKRRSSLLSHRHSHDTVPELIEEKVSKSNIVELY